MSGCLALPILKGIIPVKDARPLAIAADRGMSRVQRSTCLHQSWTSLPLDRFQSGRVMLGGQPQERAARSQRP